VKGFSEYFDNIHFRDLDHWQDCVAHNSNQELGEFAEHWMFLMEQEMTKGKKLKDIWYSTSCTANIVGLSGAMFNVIAASVSKAWAHGEELAKLIDIESHLI